MAGSATPARWADPTGKVAHHHVIADLHILHGRPYFLYDTRAFVAEDTHVGKGQMLIPRVEVGVTKAGCDDADKDLVRPRLVQV